MMLTIPVLWSGLGQGYGTDLKFSYLKCSVENKHFFFILDDVHLIKSVENMKNKILTQITVFLSKICLTESAHNNEF